MVINKKILILEGGLNEEHEVSLESSISIQKIFKKLKFKYKVLKVNPKNFEKEIIKFKNYICFNALHGTFGEDGKVQKILKKNNIKFTHSDHKSSKNCFDKIYTKKLILNKNILTPKYSIINKKDLNIQKLMDLKNLYKKFVIKPTNSGSSYGIHIIKNNNDLNNFIKKITNYKKELLHSKILVEEFIAGKELTVSTTNFFKKIEALAVTEITTKNHFFDYKAKYTKGYSKHILPARIGKKNYIKCLNLAKKIHKLLDCNSIARSDFVFNTKTKKIYFLEINTQPGLTSISLLPEQAKFRNISFENIIMGILSKTN